MRDYTNKMEELNVDAIIKEVNSEVTREVEMANKEVADLLKQDNETVSLEDETNVLGYTNGKK